MMEQEEEGQTVTDVSEVASSQSECSILVHIRAENIVNIAA